MQQTGGGASGGRRRPRPGETKTNGYSHDSTEEVTNNKEMHCIQSKLRITLLEQYIEGGSWTRSVATL